MIGWRMLSKNVFRVMARSCWNIGLQIVPPHLLSGATKQHGEADLLDILVFYPPSWMNFPWPGVVLDQGCWCSDPHIKAVSQ